MSYASTVAVAWLSVQASTLSFCRDHKNRCFPTGASTGLLAVIPSEQRQNAAWKEIGVDRDNGENGPKARQAHLGLHAWYYIVYSVAPHVWYRWD